MLDVGSSQPGDQGMRKYPTLTYAEICLITIKQALKTARLIQYPYRCREGKHSFKAGKSKEPWFRPFQQYFTDLRGILFSDSAIPVAIECRTTIGRIPHGKPRCAQP
jgi:hypothetical protein